MLACGFSNVSNPTLGVYPCAATFGRGDNDALGEWLTDGERLDDAKDAGVCVIERLGDIEARCEELE